MINILLLNFIIFFLVFFIFKRIVKNFYLNIVLIYILLNTFNLTYLNNKFLINNFDQIWLNFSFITILVTIFSWVHGIVSKSVSMKMLNSIYKNRNMNKLEKLTNKIVKKEFDKRIRILRTIKFINLKKNKFKITIKGLKLIKIVTKLRKAFNISLINFYFGK